MPEPAFPYTNRLIHEKSPYLQQHAHNPVDWFPWGEEAFQEAEKQGKPIFLSIGYATCHWCHVMERESFANPEIGKLMNELFISIKVDREELPQVDSLYMEFAQAFLSSGGGWPLNLLLTPDLKPFFAVTYLPPQSRQGMIGFADFILQIKALWESEERPLLLKQADSLVDAISRTVQVSGEILPEEGLIARSAELLFNLADPIYGGMSGAPKFPLSYQLEFLLQFVKDRGDSRALFMAELTWNKMRDGGIYDQLAGGFSRYATDEKWQIPHFEKMTYDNALLAKSYLQGFKFTKNPDYAEVTQEILRYLMREMRSPEGGFYSGQDADTEGHEGRYYTWTPLEVREALPAEEADLFCEFFGVSSSGNFDGRSVLTRQFTLEEFAEDKGMSLGDFASRLIRVRHALMKEREKRVRPLIDQKILTYHNGLMIDVLAEAGRVLNEKSFTNAALETAEFIQTHLWKEGKLLRRLCDKEARFSAVLEDYAFLIKGLLTLFESGCGSRWLKWATQLSAVLRHDFQAPRGAFFQTETTQKILVLKCEFYDGAEPSGNGVHAENLLRLYQLTHDEMYLIQAEDIFKAALQFIETYPPGACFHLLALQRYFDKKAATVVIALDEKNSLEKEIRAAFGKRFCPHVSLIWKRADDLEIDQLIPDERGKRPIDGQTAFYLCRQGICEEPLISKEEILKVIDSL